MIYFLSSLPSKTFEVVQDIFTNVSSESTATTKKGKGKAKKGTTPKMILGSTFKAFRGMDMETVHKLLYDVVNPATNTTLKGAVKKCQDIKALQKVQTAFIQTTKCGNWDAAVQLYPMFTTAEKLEPFKNLNFSDSNKVPKKFFSFCQHVMSANSDEFCDGQIEQDGHFQILHNTEFGVMWKTSMDKVDPHTVKNALTLANVTRFSGFNLCIFDLEGNAQVNYIKYNCVCAANCTWYGHKFK